MEPPKTDVLRQMLARLTLSSCLFVMFLGLAVMAGWAADIDVFKSVVPGWATMKFNTALSFFLCGLSLLLLRDARGPSGRRTLALACAGTVCLVGMMTVAEYLTGIDTGMHDLVIRPDVAGPSSGRMSLATAVGFLFISSSLLLLDHPRLSRRRLFFAMVWVIGLVGLLAVIGHIYGVKSLYDFGPFSSMAVHTALGFTVLSLGVICSRQGEGVFHALTSDQIGGKMMRRLLPLAVVLPVFVGWLRLLGERAGYYGFEFGLALFATANVCVFSFLIWRTALWLNRIDSTLSEERGHYRQLMESLPLLVWTCRPDGPCDYLGPQWVEYTGIPAESQLGFGWLEQIHPEDRERTIGHWKNTAGAGKPFEIEFRIRRRDGQYRWFKTYALPLRDSRGIITKWLGTNTDIEDVKQGEIAKARMAAIVQFSNDAMIGKNLDGTVTSWNTAACLLFGYEESEMLGRSITLIIPDDRLEEERMILAQIADGKAVRHFRTVRRHKSGSLVDISVSISPIMDQQGNVIGASKVARDISEQLALERELVRERELLEVRVAERTAELQSANVELAEAQAIAHIGSWSFNVATGEVQWSDELFRIVGIKPEAGELSYSAQSAMFTAESWERLSKAINHAVKTGEGYELELEVVRPDRTLCWTHARGRATRDALGKVAYLAGTLQDIDQLKRAKIELERSNRDLEQFAYVASHDLQEPLRAVTGCVQILQRRYAGRLDQPGDELVGHIVDGASRMQTLIHDLLSFSRVGTQGKALVPCESSDALDLALSNLRTAIADSRASLKIGAMPGVKGDMSQLAQLFQNLIGNAIKYRGPREPVISIEAREQGDMRVFSIRDNGIGIEPQYFERIFVLFQRLHTREEYAGTGIGLALCKKIVERHGGAIWLESDYGKGSVFHFTLQAG